MVKLKRAMFVLVAGSCIVILGLVFTSPEVMRAPSSVLQNERALFGASREVTSLSRQPISDEEVRRRFEERLQILQTACKTHANSTMFRSKHVHSVPLPMYEVMNNTTVHYCPIEKTGSTTWTGIFSSIKFTMAQQKEKGIWPDPERFDRDVSFVFVREPYSRLLSAYTDKLFSPNTLFWGMRGRYIVANFRENPTEHSLQCGHDVTFPEFVKYFIHMQTTGQKRDGHFIPTHDHCEMCRVPYKYVGHLETISEDMPFLLKVMHSPVNYTKTFDNVTLQGNSRMVLKSMREKIQRCMPLHEAARRLWKKWHVRGIISKTQLFPFSDAEARNVSLEDFTEKALEALAKSGEKSARIGQKKEALREAFADIPLSDKLEVKKLLFLDFEMFGFPPEPDEVFPKKPYETDTSFSYFRLY